MAKIIKLTEEHIERICKAFRDALTTEKLSDGKINFSQSLTTIKRDATVYFTEMAWIKMQSLVREFDKEVAWHGIARRGDDVSKDEYYITDILVYPQEVTGATVNTDQEKYQNWLMSQDDETFNNIRMQGHSHVNMGVTPSGVDNLLYDRILEQLEDDMFYIFMIWNKRQEKTIKIYDLSKNVLFETSDCTVKILDDTIGLESFMKDAKEKVKENTYSYTSYTWPSNKTVSTTPTTTTATTPTTVTKKDDEKSDKKKGKRKGFRDVTYTYASGYDTDYDDDDSLIEYYRSRYGC